MCASSAGVEVLATELYGDAALERDEVLARFVGDGRAARSRVYGDRRLAGARTRAARPRSTPTSSARARCRRSGTLASGAMSNLDPPRRLGRAEGAPQARARPARDAALVDPPARAGDAARGGRGHPLRRARLLPPARDGRRPRRLRRRALSRPARHRQHARRGGGARERTSAGTLDAGRGASRCSTGSRPSTT